MNQDEDGSMLMKKERISSLGNIEAACKIKFSKHVAATIGS